MEFKNIILSLRSEIGYSQEQLAKVLHVSKSTVAMWETGQRLPSVEKYEEIADYFNVDIDFLYGRTTMKRKSLFDDTGSEYVNAELLSNSSSRYYLNDEAAQAAQEIFENKELRALFDVQRDMSSDDLKALHSMALALKRKERGNLDDTGC